MYLGFDSIKIMHVVYCFHGNRVLIEMLQWSLGGVTRFYYIIVTTDKSHKMSVTMVTEGLPATRNMPAACVTTKKSSKFQSVLNNSNEIHRCN